MIIRTEKNQHYTTLANYALNDPKLSLKAKGLWAFIMSKPDNWAINYRGLMKTLKEGQRAILAALKELEDCGYLVRGKVVSTDGKFSQADATLFERPCVHKPCVQNVRVENVRTKLNTEELKTDKDIRVKTLMGSKEPEGHGDNSVNQLFTFWANSTGIPIQSKVKLNRKACYSLYQSSGVVGAERIIQRVAQMQGQKGAPVIGDFIQLNAKYNDLLIWEKRNPKPSVMSSADIHRALYPEKYASV